MKHTPRIPHATIGLAVAVGLTLTMATAQVAYQCKYEARSPVTEPCSIASGCTDTCQRTYYDEAVCQFNVLSSCTKQIQTVTDTVKTYNCVPGGTCHCPINVPAINVTYNTVDRDRCTS